MMSAVIYSPIYRRGLGVKSASLIANRGEGGQNEIGTELGDWPGHHQIQRND